MRPLSVALAASLSFVIACGGNSSPAGPTTTPISDIPSSLQKLSASVIYFGHQSVGYNIMQGLQTLVTGNGSSLRVLETTSPGSMTTGVFAHSSNGANGDPAGKTAAFDRTIRAGVGGVAKIAFFKFCYVDFGQSTDVNGVFADYVSKMAALRAAYPNVRFVHFTVPLTTGASSDNVVREKFSSLVRNTYRNREPVFDLAQVESTRPDGTTESFSGVRALVAAYSSDGGHLNAVGQQIVATALAQYLATL